MQHRARGDLPDGRRRHREGQGSCDQDEGGWRQSGEVTYEGDGSVGVKRWSRGGFTVTCHHP